MATILHLGSYTTALELARQRRGVVNRGSTNRAAVRAIQQRLSDLGYGVSVDGQFGPETEKVLRDFQRSRDAHVDGLVGPETVGKLLRAHRNKENPADTGLDAVTRVVTAGSPLPQSGRPLGGVKAQQRGGGAPGGSGRPTKAQQQRQARLHAAKGRRVGAQGGTIDPVTGHQIATSTTGPIGSTKVPTPENTLGPDPTSPRAQAAQVEPQNNNPEFNKLHPRDHGKFATKGDSGEGVSNTQEALNRVHDAGLKVDGQFGDKTDAAVRSYQQAQGLTVDGIVGPQTAGSLRRRLRLVQAHNRRQGL